MSGTTGTASTVITLTPAEEKKADKNRLLTAFVNVCGVPYANIKNDPIALASKHAGITLFHTDFIHMTAADIASLQHLKSGDLVPLELNFRMILRAFLAFYHHESHKKRGCINILEATAAQFKHFRNSEYDPTKEITPGGLAISKNEGLSNWNKLVKLSTWDFKPYREANKWVDYKDIFMITLEAQNLTHLVDPNHIVVDEDLHKAQQKYLYKVFRDNFLHHEAKSIVKFHSKTKDAALIWQKIRKTYDESISTSMNGEAILGWLTGNRLDNCNWNQTQGEYVTLYTDKIDKFNEMCPDSKINDMQAIRMLQNLVANVPNLANVLNLYRQTKTSTGQSDKITLQEYVALLAQEAQVFDNAKICTGRNYRWSAATHELDYEINAHDFDQDEEDLNAEEWFEANVMNQRDPKTCHYLGNKNGNKSTGFKKTQNYKRQVNQMQGTHSRAFMDRDTWNALGDSDKKAWDQLSEPAKTKIAAYHFNKGKEYAAQGSEVNQMEAKEHDLIFDDSEEELEAKQHDLLFDDSEEEPEMVEANNFKTIQVSNAESTRKMYEDKGVDFDMILQAQQANTCIQARHRELLDSHSSDEESVADLEVNMHNLRPKIQGLMEFGDLDSEDEFALNCPATMEEALEIDARSCQTTNLGWSWSSSKRDVMY